MMDAQVIARRVPCNVKNKTGTERNAFYIYHYSHSLTTRYFFKKMNTIV